MVSVSSSDYRTLFPSVLFRLNQKQLAPEQDATPPNQVVYFILCKWEVGGAASGRHRIESDESWNWCNPRFVWATEWVFVNLRGLTDVECGEDCWTVKKTFFVRCVVYFSSGSSGCHHPSTVCTGSHYEAKPYHMCASLVHCVVLNCEILCGWGWVYQCSVDRRNVPFLPHSDDCGDTLN